MLGSIITSLANRRFAEARYLQMCHAVNRVYLAELRYGKDLCGMTLDGRAIYAGRTNLPEVKRTRGPQQPDP